jgi:hypothetical protein
MFERVAKGVNGDTDRNDIDWTPNLVSRGVNKFGTQGRRRVCRVCNWWKQLDMMDIPSAATHHRNINSYVNNIGRSRSYGGDIGRVRSMFAQLH